jgi:hypothetical protein
MAVGYRDAKRALAVRKRLEEAARAARRRRARVRTSGPAAGEGAPPGEKVVASRGTDRPEDT